MTAAAPLLQTESTQVGAALNSRTMQDIPLGGQRNFAYLARLSPGVVPAEPGARDAANGGFSANGVRSNGQNNFLLNGVDNNINTIDFLNQTAYAIGPSVEAIGEMNVITNGYNAEYGRAAGGVVNVNLKSGTNELHGSLFEILQNKDLDANRWENNLAGVARGPFTQNQFGATAGGPIIKNRLFMFGDYQGTRIADSGGSVQNLGYSGFLTIPTAAMKKGDFSSELGGVIGTDPITGSSISAGRDLRSALDRLQLERSTGVADAVRRQHDSANPHGSRLCQDSAAVSGDQPADQDGNISQPTTTSTSRRESKSPIRATAAWTTTSATRTACSAR